MTCQRLVAPGIVALTLSAGTVAWAASTPLARGITAGHANVSSCSSAARVTLQTAYSSGLHGYAISGARLATDAACRSMAYQLTFSATNGKPLAHVAGVLDRSGDASADLTNDALASARVTDIAVVVSG